MASPRTEFDLLLEAPASVEAEMAREVLADAGIPTFLHGRDRDLAELGVVIHNDLTRPDLFVPKGRRAEAEAILNSAWDKSALSDEIALSVPIEEDPPAPSTSSRGIWGYVIGLALIVAMVLIYYYDFFTKPLA
jgi:hypothetical protein